MPGEPRHEPGCMIGGDHDGPCPMYDDPEPEQQPDPNDPANWTEEPRTEPLHRPLLIDGRTRMEIACSCGDPASRGDDEFVAHILRAALAAAPPKPEPGLDVRQAAKAVDEAWDEPDEGTEDAADDMIWLSGDEGDVEPYTPDVPEMVAALRALRVALRAAEADRRCSPTPGPGCRPHRGGDGVVRPDPERHPLAGKEGQVKPRLLDLFCGAGGAAMGYSRAGFEVVGVDIKPQPHYPFEFHQADALTYPLDGFDAIHASPPCQHYSAMRHLPWLRLRETWDSVPPTREYLRGASVPWIIENVAGAPVDGIFLCGQMFGLQFEDGTPIYRHRLFEMSPDLFMLAPGHPKHTVKITSPERNELGHVASGLRSRVLASAGVREISRAGVPGKASKATLARFGGALGIDWMEGTESTQAIPPAYTKWIGQQLIEALS